MGKLRSKEVSNDLLGPVGRWGLEWRVKANTQTPLTIPSHQVHLEVQGQGLPTEMQSRAKKGREWVREDRQKVTSTSIISIMETVLMNGDSAHSVKHCVLLITTASAYIWNGAYAHVWDIIYTICWQYLVHFCPQAPLTVAPGPSRDLWSSAWGIAS